MCHRVFMTFMFELMFDHECNVSDIDDDVWCCHFVHVCDHDSQCNVVTLLENDLSNANDTQEPITNHGSYHRTMETKKF